MRVAIGACNEGDGDVYLDYKANRPGGKNPKCIHCSRIGQGILKSGPRTIVNYKEKRSEC